MLTPDVTYKTYLAEIDRYLRDSRAFAEELKGLEREKLRESAEVSRSFEQELRCLESRVHDAEKSYEKTARMLNSGELRAVGALIPVRVRPAPSCDRLDALLNRQAELIKQIELLSRQYVSECAAEEASERRAARALEARRRALHDQLAQRDDEPPSEESSSRIPGCLPRLAAFLLIALSALGCFLFVVD